MKTEQKWKIGDCLQLLPEIQDKSIDMILTDLPYGTTACAWDTVIPFEPLWAQYMRIIKDSGSIVLTASQPFTSALIMSNIKLFKYSLVWDKSLPTGHLNAKIMPLRLHEDIIIFGTSNMVYNPQMLSRRKKRVNISNGETYHGDGKHVYGTFKSMDSTYLSRYPTSILNISNANKNDIIHPPQKPVALFEYLIKTYTNEGDTVHDSCLGSGTTLEACMNLNRNCIGFEIDSQWEAIYRKRLRLDNMKLDEFNNLKESE